MDSAAGLAHSVSPSMPVKEEGEVSDLEAEVAPSEEDQLLSKEQSYRGTVRGICSYMGWHHITKFNSASPSAYDNPRSQPTGKISVNLLTDDWLCKKLERLNLTLVEGYPS